MGRDAELGRAVHLVGADLHLDAAVAGPDDRRVERLVHVGLGQGDVVLEAPGDGRPLRVHDAEGRVAVGHVLHEHAEGDEVLHLLEVAAGLLHLAPDGVDVLDAALDVDGEAALDEHLAQALGDVVDVAVAVLGLLAHLARQLRVGVGVQVLEAQVLQLGLEPVDAEAAGERRVDLEGLARDALLRLELHVLEGAHVVEAVGELDEEHADVARHGHEHLAEALGLLVLLAGEVDAAELGDPVDQERDLGPEELARSPPR